jgi:hypothetical protein
MTPSTRMPGDAHLARRQHVAGRDLLDLHEHDAARVLGGLRD